MHRRSSSSEIEADAQNASMTHFCKKKAESEIDEGRKREREIGARETLLYFIANNVQT